MAVGSYRELIVWQRSVELTDLVYDLTSRFPKHETYGLSSQIQRDAVSVAANIAEGNGRDSTKEYLHHLSYSLGSIAETDTLLEIARRRKYVADRDAASIRTSYESVGRMLRTIQKKLKARLRE